jgi:CBS domain-containing protein
MKVADIMTRTPLAVRMDATLLEAATIMVQSRVSGLPVIDEEGSLVGMISEGDLIRRAELGTTGRPASRLLTFLSPGRVAHDYVRTHGLSVSEVMSGNVIWVSPDASLADVAEAMETHQVKRLPVMKDGRLIGIVSRADLLRVLVQLLGEREVPAISDIEIRSRVLAEIEKEKWAPRTNVDATVKDGIVELRGAVTDDRERVGLRVICENTPGVRGVHDRLIWLEPLSGAVIDPNR